MADAPNDIRPVYFRFRFHCDTVQQFAERYGAEVSTGSIFIRTRDLLAVGTRLSLDLQLQNGAPLIVGDGTVFSRRDITMSGSGATSGMGVRFGTLDRHSRRLMAQILSLHEKLPTGVVQAHSEDIDNLTPPLPGRSLGGPTGVVPDSGAHPADWTEDDHELLAQAGPEEATLTVEVSPAKLADSRPPPMETQTQANAPDGPTTLTQLASEHPSGRRERPRSGRKFVLAGLIAGLVLIGGVLLPRLVQQKPASPESRAVQTATGSAVTKGQARVLEVAPEAPPSEPHPTFVESPEEIPGSGPATEKTKQDAIRIPAQRSVPRRPVKSRRGQPAPAGAPRSEVGAQEVPAITEVTAVAARRPVAEPTGEVARTNIQPGYLSLDTAPWSNVFLGAKLLGATPLIRFPLPPGRHVLTLKNPEAGSSASYVVEIKSGATVARFVGLDK